MSKALIIVFAAIAAAFSGYWVTYRQGTATTETMLTQRGGELEWLRREYHLSDAQFARIQELRKEYAPACDAMCAMIAKANARLDELILKNKSVTPELAEALQECLKTQTDCRQAMLGHVYAVSAEMPPADGARYVETIKARIVQPPLPHAAVTSELPPR